MASCYEFIYYNSYFAFNYTLVKTYNLAEFWSNKSLSIKLNYHKNKDEQQLLYVTFIGGESIKWSNLGFWYMKKGLKLDFMLYNLCVRYVGASNFRSLGRSADQISNSKVLVSQMDQVPSD